VLKKNKNLGVGMLVSVDKFDFYYPVSGKSKSILLFQKLIGLAVLNYLKGMFE